MPQYKGRHSITSNNLKSGSKGELLIYGTCVRLYRVALLGSTVCCWAIKCGVSCLWSRLGIYLCFISCLVFRCFPGVIWHRIRSAGGRSGEVEVWRYIYVCDNRDSQCLWLNWSTNTTCYDSTGSMASSWCFVLTSSPYHIITSSPITFYTAQGLRFGFILPSTNNSLQREGTSTQSWKEPWSLCEGKQVIGEHSSRCVVTYTWTVGDRWGHAPGGWAYNCLMLYREVLSSVYYMPLK